MQLLCGDAEHVVELSKESVDALLLILDVLALEGQTYDVDGREREVTTSDRGLGSETVLEYTCTATHCSTLVLIALGIVDIPCIVLVVGSIEVDEVGEETASRYLASILVEVVVAILGQVAHATLLLPDLNGEDGCLTTTYTLVGRAQQLADDATTLGRGVRTVVDAGEYHLITTTAVNGVHVVDESLHGLVYATYGLVDSVLLQALLALKAVEREVQVVVDLIIIEVAEVLAGEFLQLLYFFFIRGTHVRSQIEVEGGNGLTTVHLVLCCLHGDTTHDAGCLDALCGTTLTMSGTETTLQDMVQGVLDAGQRLGGIVVLVVDMQQIGTNGLACILAQQVVVYEGLGGLAAELHHHTGRCVGVHVRILASHIIALNVDDLEEDVTCLGLTSHTTLVAVLDVDLCHVLAGTLHQLHFHHILDLLHRHLGLALHGDALCDRADQLGVITFLGGEHCFTDGRSDLCLVESHDSSISLYDCLYHCSIVYL